MPVYTAPVYTLSEARKRQAKELRYFRAYFPFMVPRYSEWKKRTEYLKKG